MIDVQNLLLIESMDGKSSSVSVVLADAFILVHNHARVNKQCLLTEEIYMAILGRIMNSIALHASIAAHIRDPTIRAMRGRVGT